MPSKKKPTTTIVVITKTVTTTETREEIRKPRPKKSACYRCGRTSHWANDCYAKTDTDGNELSDEE